ncbi:MAG: PEP-CTERM sorting domain-containing protein [Akkermansiaceae bacterium]|nr:PEP-CTERM sorting domain-containing protein [Akkermansiaceae bacterium]
MKKNILPISCLAAATLGFTAVSASAGVILQYDSLLPGSGGSDTQLSRVGTTDGSFVTSSDANTSIGSNTSLFSINTQTHMQGAFGDQGDMQFNFGTGPLSAALTPAYAKDNGNWIGASFTAAQDLNLNQFSFQMWNNSVNGDFYAARDAGLFISKDGGTTFTQYGTLFDTSTSNGDKGTVTFNDTYNVLSGQTVEMRVAFTDRTVNAQSSGGATRIGDIQISGIQVPEPSATALLGLAGLGFLVRRKR